MFKNTMILSALAAATFCQGASADEVNIYSYRQPELIAPLLDAFTAETGISTNVVFLQKGMAARLASEGSRSPADLAFTSDVGKLDALKQAGVLEAIENETLNENVPSAFRDPAGEWFALTTRARIVYASKDRVSENEITTYEDLADPKWAGRICIRSGLHPYNLALVAGMIENHGEAFAKEWLMGVKANLARKPQGNDRAQVKAIWAGECDISIGNTYYMALMLNNDEQKAWADAVNVEFPTFENGGTHVNVSGMALTKSAPNKDNAIRLMEFLASPMGQEIYAEINSEYPVNPSVEAAEVVETFGTFTADDANLQRLADLRAVAARLVEEVNFDG